MNIIFKQWQAPGDLLMLSVAIRDLHKCYPGYMFTDVFSCYPEVFFNNPYITYHPKNNGISMIDLKYAKIRDKLAPLGYHFSDVFIYLLNKEYNLNIEKTSMYPDIYLTPDEKSESILEELKIEKPYWIINSGIKQDIPIKGYPPSMWQKVITKLKKNGIKLIQVGSRNDIHPLHDDLYYCAVGKTENLRDFFSLVYHSEGTIGHVSLHMHVAAAFRKPSIIVAGGREDFRWEAYPEHQYLHTVGQFDCCKHRGCWVSQISDCKNPWEYGPYAKCMMVIESDKIANEVLKYN